MKLIAINPPSTITEPQIPDAIARDTEVSAAIAAHLTATDPHTQYQKKGTSSGSIANAADNAAAISAIAAGNNATEWSQNAAFISFHRPLISANYLGIDTDNQLKFGGWSNYGSAYRVWHENFGIPVWQTPSDKRFKNSVKPIKNALAVLMASTPLAFRYTAEIRKQGLFGDLQTRCKRHYGFMAQDFPIPDLVFEKEGDMGIDYIEIIPFLVRAIQELQEQINELKQQNTS